MSAGKLPEGWIESELSALGHIVTGKTPSTKQRSNFGGDIPFIKPGDLDLGGYIITTADTLTDEGLTLVPELPANSIVVTCIGNLGKVGITFKRSASNQQINALIPSGKINVQFVYYQILTLKPWLESQSAATTIAIVNKSKFSQAPFKFPPISEQKIIAEKLDTLLAQVDSTKARLEQIPKILKRFRQAVLTAAVSGKLTKRSDEYHNWQELPLSHIASHVVDCPHSTPKWSSEGKYCVRTTAFSPFNLDLSNQGYVDEKTYLERIQRLKPEADDILYSREGTVGIACQIPKGVELCLGQRMVLIRASGKMSGKYLTIVLNSNKILKIVKSKTMGSTVPRINMSDIKSYPIPFPSLPEQHEIVRRVEQLFAYADTIEKQVNSALLGVNNLTQSILAKAFRGELTEQWRAENSELISGENSAAALLEKIKAERAASTGKKASRKKS